MLESVDAALEKFAHIRITNPALNKIEIVVSNSRDYDTYWEEEWKDILEVARQADILLEIRGDTAEDSWVVTSS
jgi:hypothetical protein